MTETYWQGTERYNEINAPREIMLPAHSQIIHQILEVNGVLDKSKTVVEIGAGTGALAKQVNYSPGMINKFLGETDWGHVIQSDPNIEAILANNTVETTRTFFTKEQPAIRIVADALNLPFANNSLDYIVGFACLDVLSDPVEALSNIHKKLKPGGKFIHFQDIVPDPVALIPYAYDNGFLPVPIQIDSPTMKGYFQKLPVHMSGIFMNAFQPKGSSGDFIQNYTSWYRGTMLRELTAIEQGLIDNLAQGGFDESSFSELFGEAARHYGKKAGFASVSSAWYESRSIVGRDYLPEHMRENPDIDIVKSVLGVPRFYKFNPKETVAEFGEQLDGKVMLFGQIHGLILEKAS